MFFFFLKGRRFGFSSTETLNPNFVDRKNRTFFTPFFQVRITVVLYTFRSNVWVFIKVFPIRTESPNLLWQDKLKPWTFFDK